MRRALGHGRSALATPRRSARVALGSCSPLQTAAPAATSQQQGSPRASSAEASCASISLAAAVLGLGVGAAFLSTSKSSGSARTKVEQISISDFKEVRRASAGSIVSTYHGEDALWRGTTLRLRTDEIGKSPAVVAADAAATANLGLGRFAAVSEVLHLRLDAGEAPQPGLRLRGLDAALEELGRPVAIVELRPGNGLVELYGRPTAYSVQAGSGLALGEQARSGGFSSRDLFCRRPDRVRRAILALSENPTTAAGTQRLRVVCRRAGMNVDVFPGDRGALDGILQNEVGVDSFGTLLELLAGSLDGDGAEVLASLLRAQCSAGPASAQQAHALQDVVRRQGLSDPLATPGAFDTAFERGFWNLAPDESGMYTREREGERLLERSRRELWKPGSASRKEIEAQIRIFLCRYLIGLAASEATLRLAVVRCGDEPGDERSLRALGFAPSSQPALFCRLELDVLEVAP